LEGGSEKGLEKTAYWWDLWSALHTGYCLGDRIKDNEMGGECSM